MLSFITDFRKTVAKLENVNLDARPPSYWFSAGNYAINRVISGSYLRGLPQGRVTAYVGPSDSGKSYLLSNACAEAQRMGAFVLAIDSENALDYTYLKRVGVDTSPDKFQGVGVVTVQDVVKVISEFIDGYIKAYGKYNNKGPKVVLCIDSLSMLLTETENEHFEGGEQKGDQGQQAKQVKHFLKTMTSRMKMANMCLLVTAHVYGADPLKGEGMYSVTPALRYACSQIILITKLRLKDDDVKDKKVIAAGGNITGIRMKIETFKSRFAKIGTKVEIEVPYDTGIQKHAGLLDMMLVDDIIQQGGSWYTCSYMIDNELVTKKFQRKDFEEGEKSAELVAFVLGHPTVKTFDEMFDSFNDVEEPDAQAA